MLVEQNFIEMLKLLEVPTNAAQIRLDPPTPEVYGNRPGHPSMYLLNAPCNSYFYCTDQSMFLSLSIDDERSYTVTWWTNDKNRFAISLIDMETLYTEETQDFSDSMIWGKFFSTEEEHFQADCLKGTSITWELQALLQSKLTALSEFYNKEYYTNFLKA